MHRGDGGGREGSEGEKGVRERRGGLLSSDIVIKESPAPCWGRLLAYSHPVWLPDTFALTHTPVCAVEGEDQTDKRRETNTDKNRDSEEATSSPLQPDSGGKSETDERSKNGSPR